MSPINNTTERLISAINVIHDLFPDKEVIAIEFEDGSGLKFNFKLNYTGRWQFIDLTNFNKIIKL